MFYSVRESIMQGTNIIDIPLRVTYYARVSTLKDAQLNSLDNQITYFEETIKKNPNWTYIEGYIDEGISGSTIKNRISFLKMIDDAKAGLFDLILTKEVSRFSRSLLDSIKYTQMLTSFNVGVYFLTNNINTYDINAEFLLNMMGSVAQEEVKRLSERVKFGHQNAIKKGVVLGSGLTGYDKVKGKLIINNEASMIKTMFELYITKKYGLTKLGLALYKLGYQNKFDNIYDKNTLKNMIRNPKYKGYYCGNTSRVVDYKTKKRVFFNSNEWTCYKSDEVPAIVSEYVWELANNILDERTNNRKISKKKYLYSSKIYCSKHDKYQRKKDSWVCDKYLKYGLKGCNSPILKEVVLDSIMNSILNEIDTSKITNTLISIYKSININKKNNNYNRKKNKL